MQLKTVRNNTMSHKIKFVKYLWEMLHGHSLLFEEDGSIYKVDTSGRKGDKVLVAKVFSERIKS